MRQEKKNMVCGMAVYAKQEAKWGARESFGKALKSQVFPRILRVIHIDVLYMSHGCPTDVLTL
jgi:hypothetical protein